MLNLYPAVYSVKNIREFEGSEYPLSIAAHKELILSEDAYVIFDGIKVYL
jgi:hypothetical protein